MLGMEVQLRNLAGDVTEMRLRHAAEEEEEEEMNCFEVVVRPSHSFPKTSSSPKWLRISQHTEKAEMLTQIGFV